MDYGAYRIGISGMPHFFTVFYKRAVKMFDKIRRFV